MSDIDFSEWLLQKMESKGWSQADLARAAGLNRQSISDYINRRRTNPEPEAMIAIADAFDISPITVFRKAGLLPDRPETEVTFDDWKFLLEQLEPAEQEELRQIAVLKIERRKKQEQSARAANFKPGTVQK
jgi:transcriptional regulator with XRE-family HTH domain